MHTKLKAVPKKYRKHWVDNLDGRTELAQIMRERWAVLTSDLGGEDVLSYQQKSLVERALWLEYWMAKQENALGNDQEFNVGQWVQASNALQGIYSKLGLTRVQKQPKSITDFLSAKAKKETVK